jgi:predicted SAM-dependent methyltransferase
VITSWLRRQTTFGFRRALFAVREELHAMRRHKRGAQRARSLPVPPHTRLQLGSGQQPKAGWINVDLYASDADFQLDLREDLPFPDASFELVYAEHFFEHLEYPRDATHFLREVFRVLEPGGRVSIVIPDFGKLLRAYAEQDAEFFQVVRVHIQEGEPTMMHHVNYWFRQDGLHKYAYDAETLRTVLGEAGFDDVHSREFDPELDSALRHQLHSLYVEGEKPCRKTEI